MFPGRRARMARFVNGDPHLVCSRREPKIERQGPNIARMLASKPRVSEGVTPAEREMPPRKKLRRSPYFTVQPS
jgi:hypothetical protein